MDRQRFVIFGTGGLARELTAWVLSGGHDVQGYVTTLPEEHGRYGLPGVVLDEDRPVEGSALLAIGHPAAKRLVFERALGKGWRFGTFVHGSAVFGPGVVLAPGAVVAPHCTLSVDVTLGRSSFVNFNCGIGHDAVIGDFVQVNPGVQIGGRCTIGSETLIGSGSTIIEATAVGTGCMIGSGSVIYGRVREGQRMIAALAKRWPQ